MSELPEGWCIERLGRMSTKIGSGSTPKGGNDVYHAAGIPLIRSMNVHFDGFKDNGLVFLDERQAEKLKGVEVFENDVLLNITGASIGRVTLAPSEMKGARVNQHVAIIRLHEGLHPNYVRYFLASPLQQRLIAETESGVTRQALTKEKIENFEIPLAPLAEQKRIADKLDALLARVDRCRARLDRVPLILKRFRQAVLAAATSGQLTADWRENLGSAVESTWSYSTAEELCEWITKGTTPRKDQMYEGHGDVPYIKVYNLTFDGNLDFTINPTFIDKATHDHDLKRSRVIPGDVLMNIVGPPLGKVSLVPASYPEWNINQAIAVFRPKEKIYNQFLAYFLMTEKNISDLVRKSKATAGQFNLTLELCRSILIPVPTLNEQHEIVRRVEILFAYADRLAARYQAARAQVERLTPALLTKAFRGELVPQDPADEPAAVLLARLRGAS